MTGPLEQLYKEAKELIEQGKQIRENIRRINEQGDSSNTKRLRGKNSKGTKKKPCKE